MSDSTLEYSDPPPGEAGAAGKVKASAGAWFSLIAVALGIMVVQIDGTVVAAANPKIASDLNATPGQIQWVTTGYLLALSGLLIPAGTVADKIGRKKAFLIGVGGFSLASLLCGMSGSIEMLIGARVLQAVFASLLGPSGLAVLKASFPPAKLPAALGIFGAVTAVAMAGGPMLGGVLVEYANWSWVFYINLPFGIIGVLVGLIVIKESAQRGSEPLDIPGAIALTAAMVSAVWGITGAQDDGWASGKTLGFIGLGAVLLAVFVLIEARTEHPMVALSLFKDRSVSVGLLLMVVTMLAFFAIVFYLMFYLQGVQGKSAIMAAVSLLPLTAVFTVASPLAGWATGKLGVKGTLLLGAVLLFGALVYLRQIEVDTSGWALAPPLVLSGFGAGFLLVAGIQAIVGNAPVEKAGVASGMQQSMQQLGGTLGIAIFGSLLASSVSSRFPDALRDEFAGKGGSAVDVMADNNGVHESVALGFPPSARDAVKEQLVQGGGMRADDLNSFVDTLTRVAHQTFVDGMHLVFTISAGLTVVVGLLSLLVRNVKPQQEESAAAPEIGIHV
ncbi:DHA2 family efflux MFS transporter permease subunit [Streptomyces rugosispiralis]|uniref:DHA2 family efflux MFS transporter permease subunit n=1 Tax=Streptomyces rugosispiralis TaxID=2967341 RepID=A0ABT1UYU3_9ACTN|nr:DHA2 family efflux MFS transporter permease subunit [Streptomyces rugosispiralis]MCQ8190286.1 DHA2 family efflux MFS transporter permease subunit [Streptomyces rugosispiralis]